MSWTEYHKGRLKLIGENADEFFEKKFRENATDWTEKEIQEEYNYRKNYFKERGMEHECIWFHLYNEVDYPNKYLAVKSKIFEIQDHQFEESNVTLVTKISDNEYEYYSSFYNGGTCLEEEMRKILSK